MHRLSHSDVIKGLATVVVTGRFSTAAFGRPGNPGALGLISAYPWPAAPSVPSW